MDQDKQPLYTNVYVVFKKEKGRVLFGQMDEWMHGWIDGLMDEEGRERWEGEREEGRKGGKIGE